MTPLEIIEATRDDALRLSPQPEHVSINRMFDFMRAMVEKIDRIESRVDYIAQEITSVGTTMGSTPLDRSNPCG